MVIMNLKLDNLLVFNNFEMNFSYPKKIVNSSIENEHLLNRPNFRYRKLVVLMGANATGKTALGKVIMGIFNFINRKEYSSITPLIEDKTREASFVIDLAFPDCQLYRVSATISPKENEEYEIKDINVVVKNEYIKVIDNYERCAERLDNSVYAKYDNYIAALEAVPSLSWSFKYPIDSSGVYRPAKPSDLKLYCKFLNDVLKVLDPRIIDVVQIKKDNTFIVKYEHHNVVINDGIVDTKGILSSGTIEGIGVADMIATMKLGACDFYYCDEKFSHIHSDAEKAFLSLFIELLGDDRQLIFTSHNSDVLDMNLPKHSYVFLKRNNDNNITCEYASDYLKRNNESLKNAVENDLFSTAPDVSSIYSIVG